LNSDAASADGAYSKQLVRGSVWMIAARWAVRLIGLASTVILARLLTPADFGVIAMAIIVSGLLETIAYAGVDLALMRAGNDTRAHYDTAWTVQLIQAVIVGALLLFAAPIAAAYFAEPRAAGVIYLIALKSVVDGLQNIGIVAFRKELDFAKEFRFMLYSKLLNFAVIVGTAFWLRSYWALAIGMVSASVINVALSYLMHPYRPRWSLAKVREIWSFSQWLLISRIGAFFNRRTDEFVVGGMVGTSAMGNYHVASELSTMPSSELVMPMRRAMFPTLAKLSSDSSGFGSAVLDTFSTIAAVCMAVGFGLMSVAPELVQLFLGQKWLSAIPLVRWLALFGGFSALVLVLEVPLWVSGRTHFSALQTWLELALLVPLVWWAIKKFGIEGAAASRTVVSFTMIPLMLYLTARGGLVSVAQLLRALLRPLTAGVVMALLLAALPLAAIGPIALALALKVALGGLIYVSVLSALWLAQGRPAGFEANALGQIKGLLARRNSTPS
jgi:lipopolysaccharide exporter